MEGRERISEKDFSNGDLYVGNFKGSLPHGKGKYTWSDGTVYEGDWEEGKMTGRGLITWSSGAKYEGDFSGGHLHGFGTFSGLDGSIYRGSWRVNVLHGFGTKQHCNLDIYEGSWKEGVHEGSGSYSWNGGNTYIGSWKSGKMCDRGVMKWTNGDLFDGLWLNGLRHGYGIYRFADGGYYFGTWSQGLKDGKGIFYPAGSKHPSLKKWCSSHKYDDDGMITSSCSSHNSSEEKAERQKVKRSLSEKNSISGLLKSSSQIVQKERPSNEQQRSCDLATDFVRCDSTSTLLHTSEEINTLVYERDYMQGVLIKERIINHMEISKEYKELTKISVKDTDQKSFMDILKDRHSYYLRLNLQLGIRYTVGKITPILGREVRSSDFGDQARIRVYFPRKGSQFTPPHYSIDFYWKDYCPMVFRNLRELFKIDAAAYMMSISGNDGLREFSSSGKSGSIFYLSHDDRFVIKTLSKSELKVLLRMLPQYHKHVHDHENTLITKFFGLHQIKLKGGRKVRFVVMGNMFFTELRIHDRYDLKGSTHGRQTYKDKSYQNTILKDLDLTYEFHMDKLLQECLFEQISLDCTFLESQQIIDYSLLLGLHFSAPEHLKSLEPPAALRNHESLPYFDGKNARGELLIPPKSPILVTHEPRSVGRELGPHIRGRTLKAYSLGDKEVDLLLPGTGRLPVQLGVNLPAQAHRKVGQDNCDSTKVGLFEVYDVVLYMGIIDILQEYNLRKKLEHAYKSKQVNPVSISIAEPKFYAKRFINFLDKVFLPYNEES